MVPVVSAAGVMVSGMNVLSRESARSRRIVAGVPARRFRGPGFRLQKLKMYQKVRISSRTGPGGTMPALRPGRSFDESRSALEAVRPGLPVHGKCDRRLAHARAPL